MKNYGLNKKKRVMVAMSGGVDSAVGAALLKRRGYEVIGMTMCFGSSFGGNLSEKEKKRPSCCDISGVEDARRVAQALGIRHYVSNFANNLYNKVIKNFCAEYLAGRTPNPCVRCNQFLKFEHLIKKALALSCDYLATGHYAKVQYSGQRRMYLLKKGRDNKKDQSYFLYAVKREVLSRLLFPLGVYTKDEVRQKARDFNLPVSDKAESQEICFVPDNDYRGFIAGISGRDIRPGDFFHVDGRHLGRHKGVAFYTIGQRKALCSGQKRPLYVIKIDAAKNTVILGEENYLYSQGLIAKDVNFLSLQAPKKIIAINAKIRYNHQEVKSRLIPINSDSVRIEFTSPQRAVAPGQSVVFYGGSVVLGGGIISEVIANK
ncbi:MAG: tRNA 2-thiouridine(34) synthase MnmA [Candidatus Omnitrophica bacterium CG11_big_fil_rev_8_21_14_0_20_42_13]|uniref:tRNA-specific 2-thiouridylase MnmA n=1 Tax=Candidatus Ghiorseimicrobium undicola TaxID=1974746 RepID=A0A2H0LWW1_9BACT|nr:MAG: tRNA 2-thiouridine(34) synthase MnmA [Candidatus Omnitrophica bacterium CG11_big_fil_rev_8_21_14_0_20_42_13]